MRLSRFFRQTTEKEAVEGLRDPTSETSKLLAEYIAALRRNDQKPSEIPALRALRELQPPERGETVRAALSYLQSQLAQGSPTSRYWHVFDGVAHLAREMLSRGQEWTDDDLVDFLGSWNGDFDWFPGKVLMNLVEAQAKDRPLSEDLRSAVQNFRRALARDEGSESRQATRNLADRVELLLAGAVGSTIGIEPVDAWTLALRTALDGVSQEEEAVWIDVLAHCDKATSAKPSKKWLKEAEALVSRFEPDALLEILTQVYEAVGTAAPFPVQVVVHWEGDIHADGDPKLVADRFSNRLRGVVWLAAVLESPSMLAALGDLAERCYKKLRGHGPLAPKIGNAAVYVLSQSESMDGVSQLTRIRSRVKHASSRRQIERAMEAAAKRAGLEPVDLEELAVPTCGLTAVGSARSAVGGFEAELSVTGLSSNELVWRREDGKAQKSVPKSLKENYPEAVKAITDSANEIKKLLPPQRDRIEQQMRRPRTLSLRDWKNRYCDHPLVGFLARRLIWQVGDGEDAVLALPVDGGLTDLQGTALKRGDDEPIRLWHPISSTANVVSDWRQRLADLGVTQPFKQAYREIYIVTDAERQTRTYSNRFAAHVLRQHQFHALCQQRGWHYTLQGNFDSHNTPVIDLPDHGYRVEFWVDPIGDVRGDISESGIFLYVASDQVRFYRLRESGPVALDQVPPLLFSELMRDVDLFVGVCSVGNDPTWHDGGPEGRYVDYWSTFAFGELSESARTRRDALERLVPKLKIAGRCSFEERFLVVRGDLRTYRIHLGSGNVLMSPNDEYLCIVPGIAGGRKAQQGILLPFEGDSTLSLIVSKAFLLADDKKIRDPTITSQIGLH